MKMKLTSIITLTILTIISFNSAYAKSINVPKDYPTIQGAIDASADGDEVVVSPGVYSENVAFNRLVVLRSTFDGHDWSIVENTVIKPLVTNSAVASNYHLNNQIPTIRGFRITREPIPVPTTYPVWANGINGDLNVEYNIIENQLSMEPTNRRNHGGAILNNTGGIIQNNIIRNNRADDGTAFYGCGQGIIRNNIIYGNRSDTESIVVSCNSKLINNTFYDNTCAVCIASQTGDVINNIIWKTNVGIPIGNTPPPRNCLIQGYTGPGVGNTDSDPKFVNPAKGDFHLRPDSPAIDTGISTAGLTIDLDGNARGAVWHTQGLRGDGSHTDIGAYEFQPKPVTLWLPNDSTSGSTARSLEVDWALQPEAGQAITLELCQGTQTLANFGTFTAVGPLPTADTPASATLSLPPSLAMGADYFIRGKSTLDNTLSYDSTLFTVPAVNALQGSSWNKYY